MFAHTDLADVDPAATRKNRSSGGGVDKRSVSHNRSPFRRTTRLTSRWRWKTWGKVSCREREAGSFPGQFDEHKCSMLKKKSRILGVFEGFLAGYPKRSAKFLKFQSFSRYGYTFVICDICDTLVSDHAPR